MAEEDLFNKTNFYLLLFFKLRESLHPSYGGPRIKVEMQSLLQDVTDDRKRL